MSETKEEQKDNTAPVSSGQQKQLLSRQERSQRWLEIARAVVLGLVALATAWSSYQAARWGGQQSTLYTQASALRVKSTGASALAGQYRLFDVEMVSNWINAHAQGNTRLAEVYERRFRPELRVAFQAWLATDPFHNPSAPPGPFFMPQYKSSLDEQASRLDAQAERTFEEGQAANEQSDAYVLNTVFLAVVLFLAAIIDSFKWNSVRTVLLLIGLGMLLFGIYHLITYPVI